jgi:GT2 family glycosyltransferase
MLKIAGVNTSAAYSELYFTCLVNMGLTDEAEKELHSVDNTIPGIDEVISGARKKIKFLRDFRKKLAAAYEKNDFPAIKNIIQFYLSNAGNVYDTVFALGKMLAAVNEKSMAYGYLKLALMFNPENTECFNLLMEVSATAKDKQDAENMRNRLLQQLPLYDGKLSEEKVNPDESSPLISVIITTYNRKDKLPAAVKSVLAQEYKNLELIIVNDAGEDVTDIINAFNDSGIKLINHKANKGLPAARNTGIKAAKGEYIALLDDDDIYYPDHLSVVLPYLKEYDVVYTDAVRSTIKKINGIEKETARTVPYSIDYDRNKLLIANIAPVNCFVFKKSITESAGLFDESLPALEDWEFWIRLSGKAEFKHIKQNTVQVNWFDDGSTMTTSRQNEFGKARDCIYKKYAEQIKSVPGKEKIVAEFNAIWRNDFKQEPIVSIIALTYNQLDYTKAFVESVFHNTSLPFELILIDNNSSDSTGEYLTQLAASKNKVKVFLNKENAGFPGGINQGIKAASGMYILVANNDILVTENWLNRMVEAAENNPSVGIVGPVSNSVSGVQVDKDAKYSTIEEMFEYAAKVSTANKGKSFIFPRIAFLCTLVKKEVIDKIGGLDERFSPGNFEDDDFCLRAQMAGYKALVLQDVFIHHFGSKSFTAEGTQKYIARLEKNKQIFVNKWGADPEEIWLKGKQVNNRKLLYPLNANPFMEYFERAAIHIEEKEYDTAEVMLKKALSVIGEKGNYPVTEDDIHNLLLNIETLKMCEL